jgi:hypothetical protein
LSRGLTDILDTNEEEWNDIIDEWIDIGDKQERNVKSGLKQSLKKPIKWEDDVCGYLEFKLLIDGDKRTIQAMSKDQTPYITPQVSKNVIIGFANIMERRKMRPGDICGYLENKVRLDRSFILLKRYEGLGLTRDAYKITYPVQIDFDMYATLLTRSTDSFYSPILDLEAVFGAVGYPLSIDEPPFGSKLSLNLLYANDAKLKEMLLQKALSLVIKGNTIYIATLNNIGILDKSKYKKGQPILLNRDKVTHTVLGKPFDKQVLLYTLIPKEELDRDINNEEDSEEEEAEEIEVPKIVEKRTNKVINLKTKRKQPALQLS